METSEHLASGPDSSPRAAAGLRRRKRGRLSALTGGGTDGNEELTAIVGVILIALLAVVGLTILRIRELISLHLFLGLLVIGPVALKMASTGYRFTRYYTRDRAYRQKGPPQLLLRLVAPGLVLTTAAVLASGIVLLFEGPNRRGMWLSIHKVSFFAWLAFTGIHVLGHLPGLPGSLRATHRAAAIPGVSPGGIGRSIAVAGALVGGVVLAIVLIPQFGAWTTHGAFVHHHH